MTQESWTPELGIIVRPTESQGELRDLDVGALREGIAAHGVVLLRGFAHDGLSDFQALTERFELPFLRHGGIAHEPLDGVVDTIRMVTAGTEAVGLHSEVSGLPVRPDYLWLHCVQPAAVGGETVLCDGAALWSALPEHVQQTFRERRLYYSSGERGITPTEWKAAFDTEDPAHAEACIEAFAATLDPRFEEMVLKRVEGDRFVGHYAISAVVPSPYGKAEAFANALFGPYRVFPTFEGGEPVQDELLSEIGAAFGPLCRPLRWQAGDVVMVDNWRVLHGRLPFLGARKIVTRMGGTRCGFRLFSGPG